MADFYVPIATNAITDLNQQIAAGPPKPDLSFISNALENYQKGGDIRQQIGLRDMFQNGIPMANGMPDYSAISKKLLQIGGAGQIQNAIGLGNAQIGRDVLSSTGVLPSAPPSSSTAIPSKGYGPQIASAAGQYGVDPSILTKQIGQESNFNPNAVSPKGAQGIAQFMPGTAQQYGVNPQDPNSAIPGAAHYDADLLKKYNGNQGLALAAYNWGPGNVDKWLASGGDPSQMPRETQVYVAKITGKPIQGWTQGQAQPGAAQPSAQPTGQPAQPTAQPAQAQGPTGAAAIAQPGINADTVQRYENAAAVMYQRAEGTAVINPAMSAAFKAQGDAYMKQAQTIRQSLGKNSEATPDLKQYQQSVAQGYKGSFSQWQADQAGMQEEAKTQVQNLGKLATAGIDAKGRIAQLNAVEQLGERVGYGAVPKLQSFLGEYGIDTKGLSDIQAYERAIDFLAPQLRPVGSGRLMQQELAAFKSSLGGLMTTPAGRKMSLENLKLISQYAANVGNIAADTSLTPSQRFHQIYSMQPPKLNLNAPQSAGSGPAVGSVINGFKFNGGNPNDQKSWTAVEQRS